MTCAMSDPMVVERGCAKSQENRYANAVNNAGPNDAEIGEVACEGSGEGEKAGTKEEGGERDEDGKGSQGD